MFIYCLSTQTYCYLILYLDKPNSCEMYVNLDNVLVHLNDLIFISFWLSVNTVAYTC